MSILKLFTEVEVLLIYHQNSHNLLTRGESSKKMLGVQGLLVLNPLTPKISLVILLTV